MLYKVKTFLRGFMAFKLLNRSNKIASNKKKRKI